LIGFRENDFRIFLSALLSVLLWFFRVVGPPTLFILSPLHTGLKPWLPALFALFFSPSPFLFLQFLFANVCQFPAFLFAVFLIIVIDYSFEFLTLHVPSIIGSSNHLVAHTTQVVRAGDVSYFAFAFALFSFAFLTFAA